MNQGVSRFQQKVLQPKSFRKYKMNVSQPQLNFRLRYFGSRKSEQFNTQHKYLTGIIKCLYIHGYCYFYSHYYVRIQDPFSIYFSGNHVSLNLKVARGETNSLSFCGRCCRAFCGLNLKNLFLFVELNNQVRPFKK